MKSRVGKQMILPVLGVTGVIIVGALLLTKQQQERNRGQSAEGSQPLASESTAPWILSGTSERISPDAGEEAHRRGDWGGSSNAIAGYSAVATINVRTDRKETARRSFTLSEPGVLAVSAGYYGVGGINGSELSVVVDGKIVYGTAWGGGDTDNARMGVGFGSLPLSAGEHIIELRFQSRNGSGCSWNVLLMIAKSELSLTTLVP